MTDLTENDFLMLSTFYSRQFSAQNCERVLSIPTDENLDSLWYEDMKKNLPLNLELGKLTRQLIPYNENNEWLFQMLSSIIYSINEDKYGFEIEQLAGTQIIEISEGMRFPWHVDMGDGPYSLRKLGLIIFLSPRNSYEGGHLQMGSGTAENQDQELGSFCIYPAYIMKRFTPVTKGNMKALMTWGIGKRGFV